MKNKALQMENITLFELNEKCNIFSEFEKRGTFYDMAINLIKAGFEIEAYFLILATWNFATFRYAMKDFDINLFKEVIKNKCNPIFDKLKYKRFESVDFDDISDEVKELYTILSSIKGVKYTGASKLMHLKNPRLFVMWDGYIKKYYGFRSDPEDYLNFLKKMQLMFCDINWMNDNKTLTKVIDEYNYVSITFPALKKVQKID